MTICFRLSYSIVTRLNTVDSVCPCSLKSNYLDLPYDRHFRLPLEIVQANLGARIYQIRCCRAMVSAFHPIAV